ncbi:hypothetical protein Tco_0205133 [Tanacetum coccineum]
MQQPMQNPKDISDPTTALDMALELMSKAFQLNNITPTNNNQRSSSNPCYNQITQSGMNIDKDRHMIMVDDNVGNRFRENAVQNVGHLDGQHANGNGNVVAAHAEGLSVLLIWDQMSTLYLSGCDMDWMGTPTDVLICLVIVDPLYAKRVCRWWLNGAKIERSGLKRDMVLFIKKCGLGKSLLAWVFLAIVDAFVRSEFEISSWRGARVDVRTYLLGGAIDGSEANEIIRNPKLELESSRFTFDLVPLSYESVDVVVGKNWLLRHKAELELQGKGCSKGNLLWEASVLLGRKKGGVRVAREDDRGVTEGREDVREVFQQRGSRAKRKLSRCGRNQIGFESMLGKREKVIACTSRQLKVLMKDCMTNVFQSGKGNVVLLPGLSGRRSEAKNEFEIDVRRSDLEMESGSYWLDKVWTSIWRDVRTLAIEEAYTTKYSIHPGADTMLCGFSYQVWSVDTMRGGDYHSSMDVLHLKHGMERNVGYRFMGRNWRELWVVEGLTLERCSTFGKKDKLEPSYVGPFEILGWIGPIVRLRISVL